MLNYCKDVLVGFYSLLAGMAVTIRYFVKPIATVQYPRKKLVMTSPVELPMYGKFKKMQLSKENLLAFWDMILNRSDFNVSTGEKVEDIKREENGIFTVATFNNQYRARTVVLALGRARAPRTPGTGASTCRARASAASTPSRITSTPAPPVALFVSETKSSVL